MWDPVKAMVRSVKQMGIASCFSVLVAAIAAFAPMAASAAVVARVGDVVDANHPNTLALERLAEIVKEKTHGAVDIQVFPNSQLGGEKDMADGIRLGSVQGADINVSVLSSWVPEGQIFDLPFIFKSPDQAYRVCSGPIGQALARDYEPFGFHVLGFWINGIRYVMSKTPIIMPEDVRGKKMRVIESPLHIALWRLLGADPTPLPFTETYNALQTGVVDFTDNSISTYYDSHLYEVAPNLSMTGHIYSIGAILFSQRFWQRLTKDQQNIITAAVTQIIPYQNKLIEQSDQIALKKAETAGAKVHQVDQGVWRKAMAPIWQQWAPKVGGISAINAVVNTP